MIVIKILSFLIPTILGGVATDFVIKKMNKPSKKEEWDMTPDEIAFHKENKTLKNDELEEREKYKKKENSKLKEYTAWIWFDEDTLRPFPTEGESFRDAVRELSKSILENTGQQSEINLKDLTHMGFPIMETEKEARKWMDNLIAIKAKLKKYRESEKGIIEVWAVLFSTNSMSYKPSLLAIYNCRNFKEAVSKLSEDKRHIIANLKVDKMTYGGKPLFSSKKEAVDYIKEQKFICQTDLF